MSEPALSVVIPAYNEAPRLPRTLARLSEWLRAWPGGHELLVVDDGSRDGTEAAATTLGLPGLRVLRHEPNRGKGYAVRQGMLAARGGLRLMTDADLSTPIEELPRLVERLEQGCDVVIGSRALPGATIERRQPWMRESAGRVFNLFVRAVAVPGLGDTQCGFKLFTRRAAQEVFARARLDGFSFDVEALFIARKLGYRVCEVPVRWRNDEDTHVGLVSGFQAFPDLARIRLNGWRGRYSAGTGASAGTSTSST
jgi:dolichyl-phosphate beta-glucosyltransferase